MDPESAVVKLCVLGIEAEAAGRRDEAAARFREAWDARSSDLEACIAAHYVARHQPRADETLRWNAVALELATRCDHDAVRTFYPSLYLNLAHSHEMQGDLDGAAAFYRSAAAGLCELPPSPYADLVRGGVASGLERLGAR